MPYISQTSNTFVNQDICFVVGSGFSKPGFRLHSRKLWRQNDDSPSEVSRRNPSGVVIDYIRNGRTDEKSMTGSHISLFESMGVAGTQNLTLLDDTMCYFTVDLYRSGDSPNFWLTAFNTSEGSGNNYMVNQPEFYWCPPVVKRGEVNRIVGRNFYSLTSYTNTVTTGLYGNKAYLQDVSDTNADNLYPCPTLGPDTGGQEFNEQEAACYDNFVVPTTVPEGSYNLYYYCRWNKHRIISTPITVSDTAPSSLIYNVTDFGAQSHLENNQSLYFQNAINTAGSAVRNTTNMVAYVNVPKGNYPLGNRLVLMSGVYLISKENARLEIKPNLVQSSTYSVLLPSVYNNLFNTTIKQSAFRLTEYCGIEGFEIINGSLKMAVENCILLEKFLITGSETWGGNIRICNNKVKTPVLKSTTLFYTVNYQDSITIEDNDVECYRFCTGDTNEAMSRHLRRRWNVERNNVKSIHGRFNGRVGELTGIECSVIDNRFENFGQGITADQNRGPQFRNLVLRNTFINGGENFNSSENILMHMYDQYFMHGQMQNIMPSSFSVPASIWSSYQGGKNANNLKYATVYITNGDGYGQHRYILSNDAAGSSISIHKSWDVVPTASSWIQINVGCYQNMYCGNRITNTNGGMEFWGQIIDNYISNNEFYKSGKGLMLFSNIRSNTNKYFTYNAWNKCWANKLNDSQINIVSYRASGVPMFTLPNNGRILFANSFVDTICTDSPIHILDDVVNSTSDRSYGKPHSSSLFPSIVGLIFARHMSDSIHHRVFGNKHLPFVPINTPLHGLSGLILSNKTYNTGYSSDTNTMNTISVNGVIVSKDNCTKPMKYNVCKWGHAS